MLNQPTNQSFALHHSASIVVDDKQFLRMAAVAVSQATNQLENPRDKALQDYRKKILEHKEIEGRLKESKLLK